MKDETGKREEGRGKWEEGREEEEEEQGGRRQAFLVEGTKGNGRPSSLTHQVG
jgi:hypothetical protein